MHDTLMDCTLSGAAHHTRIMLSSLSDRVSLSTFLYLAISVMLVSHPGCDEHPRRLPPVRGPSAKLTLYPPIYETDTDKHHNCIESTLTHCTETQTGSTGFDDVLLTFQHPSSIQLGHVGREGGSAYVVRIVLFAFCADPRAYCSLESECPLLTTANHKYIKCSVTCELKRLERAFTNNACANCLQRIAHIAKMRLCLSSAGGNWWLFRLSEINAQPANAAMCPECVFRARSARGSWTLHAHSYVRSFVCGGCLLKLNLNTGMCVVVVVVAAGRATTSRARVCVRARALHCRHS